MTMGEESAARRSEVAWSTSVILERDVHAPAATRRLVESLLDGDPSADVVALLASELVTNAVRYGSGEPNEVEVSVAGDGDGVLVEVLSPGEMADGDTDTPGGFGLLLVDQLADEWGIEATGRGRVRAWFRTDGG